MDKVQKPSDSEIPKDFDPELMGFWTSFIVRYLKKKHQHSVSEGTRDSVNS
jgi:hypothetical protein